jgi:hypothetical protein
MRGYATRLLTLVIYAAPLMAVPTMTPAKAATNDSREVEKGKKKIQRSPGITDSRPATPKWPPPMEDDFDRKNGGGGGM